MPRSPFTRFWSRQLHLSPDEVAQFLRMSIGLLFLGIAFSTGTVAAESMILGKGGAAALPGAFEFQQGAVLVAAAVYMLWGRDARPDRPFTVIALLALIAGLGCALELHEGIPQAPVFLWGLVHAVVVVSLVHFHNVRGVLLDAQLTKALLPRFLAVFSVGKLLGGLISLFECLLTPTWCGLIYAGTSGLAGLALAWPHRRMLAPGGAPVAAVPRATIRQFWGPVALHPLSRWSLAAAAVVVIIERSFELTAGARLVQAVSPGKLELVLAIFTSVGALGAVLIQLLIIGPLILRHGPARVTIGFPVVALGIAGLVVIAPGLSGALLARFAFAYLAPAAVDPVYGLLEGGLPVPLARKIRVMKSGVVRPLMTVVVALVAGSVFFLPSIAMAAIACGVLACMCLVLPALYARTWVEILQNRGSGRMDLDRFRRSRSESTAGNPVPAPTEPLPRVRSIALRTGAPVAEREQAILELAARDWERGSLRVIAAFEIRRAGRVLARLRRLGEAGGPPGSVGLNLTRAILADQITVSFYVAIRALTAHMGDAFFLTALDGLRNPSFRIRAQALESIAACGSGGLPLGALTLAKEAAYLARLYLGYSLAGCASTGSVAGRPWLGETVPAAGCDAGVRAGLTTGFGAAGPTLQAAICWALWELTRDPGVPGPVHPLVKETLDWLAAPSYPQGMPTIARVAFLKGTAFFSGFAAEDLQIIAEAAQIQHFDGGDTIFKEGDTAHELFIVIRGAVEVAVARDGHPVRLAVLAPMEILGELSLFDELPRSATATARGSVDLLSISRTDLTAILARVPMVAMAFLRSLSLRFRENRDRLLASLEVSSGAVSDGRS